MKKLISILGVLILFSSCLTMSRIERNCDKFAKICIEDTKVEIIYRDTTIYRTDTILVMLPRDTVKIVDTVTIKDGMAFLPTIHKQFGIIGVDAGVDYNILSVIAYLTDSTLLQPIHDTITLKEVIREQATTKTVKVKYIPVVYSFALYLLILMFVIFVLWIINRKYKIIKL